MANIKKAQNWLEDNYQNKEGTKEINFLLWRLKAGEKDTELEGEILIDGYSNLEKIDFSKANGITKVTINNCPNITMITLYGNPVTEIVGMESLLELTKLNCGNTKISEIDFNKNVKLREFYFHDTKQKIEFKGFRSFAKNLVTWNSVDGISFPWEEILDGTLLMLEVDLGIDPDETEGMPIEEREKFIIKRAEQFWEIKKKVSEIPGLIDEKENKVNDDKLNELKELDENKGDVTEKIKRLEEENEILKDYINQSSGNAKLQDLQELIAQIQVAKK